MVTGPFWGQNAESRACHDWAVPRFLLPTVLLLTALTLTGCASHPAPASHPAAKPRPAAAKTQPAPVSTPTPQFTPAAGGTCPGMTANWTPMLSDPTGITVTTYASGPLTVQVLEGAATTATKNVTVSMANLPYSIEVTGVHPSAVTEVDLYSNASDGQAAAHCTVLKG